MSRVGNTEGGGGLRFPRPRGDEPDPHARQACGLGFSLPARG